MGWHVHGFRNVEDRHGRWWRNFRAHYWFSNAVELPVEPFVRETVDGEYGLLLSEIARPRMATLGWTVHVGGEFVHGASFGGIGGKVSTTGEETLDVHYALGRLLHHYWSLDVEKDGKHVRIPVPVRFTIDVGLTQISWCFGQDPQAWARDESWPERLRRNHLQWWRVRPYHDLVVDLATAERMVPLPEGDYPVTLTLRRRTSRIRVGPYQATRRGPWLVNFYLPTWLWKREAYEVDIKAPDGLPVPGNPESDISYGPDFIFGTGVTVSRESAESTWRWAEEAVAAAVAAVNRTRVRYGKGVRDTGR